MEVSVIKSEVLWNLFIKSGELPDQKAWEAFLYIKAVVSQKV